MEKEMNFVHKKEQPVSTETLKKIEENLLEQKKQILEDLAKISKQDGHELDNRSAQFPEYGDKPDENAQEINDFSTTVATQKVLEKSLEDIKQTLDRIKKGTYGICKYCHKPIGEKRLLARPTAGACISCKTKLQQKNE